MAARGCVYCCTVGRVGAQGSAEHLKGMEMRAFPLTLTVPIILAIQCVGCEESGEESATTTSPTRLIVDGQGEPSMLIKPGESVGDIRFGMTLEDVHNILGTPDFAVPGSMVYTRLGVAFRSKENIVNTIICGHSTDRTSPLIAACKFRTDRGVGMGSTEVEIVAAYGQPTMTSQSKLIYKELSMVFTLADGKVIAIEVVRSRKGKGN